MTTTIPDYTEAHLRDWLNDHLEVFTQGIGNYDTIVEQIDARMDVKTWAPSLQSPDLVMRSYQHLVDQRAAQCLRDLSHNGTLVSLGIEYELLESPVGKKTICGYLSCFYRRMLPGHN